MRKIKLPDSFYKQYIGKQPKWGPIGNVVALRTYVRFKEDEGRRERWDEVVKRVVEFSLSLYPEDAPATDEELIEEGKKLYDLIFNLKAFPAGRTLFTGGTPISYSDQGQINFNCAFQDIKALEDFSTMVILLMSGSGVGFRVTQDNIDALNANVPLVNTDFELEIKPYEFVGEVGGAGETTFDAGTGTLHIAVGDSREGWASAVESFIRAFTMPEVRRVRINLDRVRPLGYRLRTFGGYASGPEPLIQFFKDAYKVLTAPPTGWTDIKALDISNMIGRMVVAGGTRRSAQIALGDSEAFADAKTGNWWSTAPWRTQSNNTLVFSSKPSRRELERIFERIMQYGEPGFLNEEAAKKRRPNFRGINPCAEILLDDSGFCNLVTVNLMAFLKPDNSVDLAGLKEAFRLITRHALRITNVSMPQQLHEWDYKQKRDRLLGVSFTGYGDLVDSIGYEPYGLLETLREVVHAEAERYASEMRVPAPLLATTVKPEGTISQLPGVSSGLHPNYAPYYIRRVRISKMDAVAQALQAHGFTPKPEVGFNSLEDAHTWVFEFPVKTPAKRKAHDYSAIEQLERYRKIAKFWADHNPSITVYVAKEEVPEVIDWLLEHWDEYIAVSFLPKDDNTYPLMPYEAIDRERYNWLSLSLPNLSQLGATVDAIEQGTMQATDDFEACDTGACPIR